MQYAETVENFLLRCANLSKIHHTPQNINLHFVNKLKSRTVMRVKMWFPEVCYDEVGTQ